jgi:hypothetical protein
VTDSVHLYSPNTFMDLCVGPAGASSPSWPLRAETARAPNQSSMQPCPTGVYEKLDVASRHGGSS